MQTWVHVWLEIQVALPYFLHSIWEEVKADSWSEEKFFTFRNSLKGGLLLHCHGITSHMRGLCGVRPAPVGSGWENQPIWHEQGWARTTGGPTWFLRSAIGPWPTSEFTDKKRRKSRKTAVHTIIQSFPGTGPLVVVMATCSSLSSGSTGTSLPTRASGEPSQGLWEPGMPWSPEPDEFSVSFF